MADEKKKRFKKRKSAPKQDWKPHWALNLLHKIWMIAFSVFKIAAGAAATVLLILVVCGFVFAGILGDYLQEDILPSAVVDIDKYDQEQNSTLYYLDSEGQIQILQQIHAETSSKWAAYEDIPKDLIHAAVAIEDHRFYEHQGVDWITTIKACARMFFGDASVGGSSITQQLIKNTLLLEDDSADDVTVRRKVMEIFRAVQVEKRYDKETIMERYLNMIYLGQSCRGVRSAAATYFGKELEMLTTAECASLISITNSPTYYDPYQNFDNNKERKEDVLWAMKDYGWLTQEEYDEAIAQEIVLKAGITDGNRLTKCPNEACGYRNIRDAFVLDGETYYCPACNTMTPVQTSASQDIYSYYSDTVIEDVSKHLAEMDGVAWNDVTQEMYYQQIQKGGYHIYTCIDMDVQDQVDLIYTDLTQIPPTRGGQQLQSAIVIIDNKTGDIVAMSGGVGEKEYHDALNRATDSELQSGSSIKPISIYAPAFETGEFSPATVIKDLPLNYDDGPWPRNADRIYEYAYTIRGGVVSSINAVAANVLDQIGTNYSYNYAKEKFGLSTLIDEYVDSWGIVHSDNDYAPLAMGAQTWGVSVRDMANAFATFANNGVRREGRTFTKVYDSEGNLVIDNTQQSETILAEKTVNYMNYCLVNAAQSGTGYEADLSWTKGITTAGKTGTTGDNKDRWFCGFTGYYTAAVWCGFDQPEVQHLINGGNPASQLWKKVMAPLHTGKDNISLYNSYVMTGATVCLDSGGLATEACKSDIRAVDGFDRIDSVSVYPEDVPDYSCDKHVLVDYCVTGKGVATEYCQHFAEVDETVEIGKKGLVKMTQEEIDELLKAEQYRLEKVYLQDDYVYLVNDDGEDAVWKGFHKDINKDVEAPYLVCPVHTQEAWEEYQKQNQEPEPEPEPSEPSIPSLPGMPNGIFG